MADAAAILGGMHWSRITALCEGERALKHALVYLPSALMVHSIDRVMLTSFLVVLLDHVVVPGQPRRVNLLHTLALEVVVADIPNVVIHW